CGTSATGDQEVGSADDLRTFFSGNFGAIRIQEAGCAFKHGYLIAAQLGLDDFNLAGHDGIGAEDQVLHGNLVFDGVAAAVERALAKSAQIKDRFTESFAGDGAGVYADATNGTFFLNDSDLLAQFGRTDGALLSGRTAADYNEIVLLLH